MRARWTRLGEAGTRAAGSSAIAIVLGTLASVGCSDAGRGSGEQESSSGKDEQSAIHGSDFDPSEFSGCLTESELDYLFEPRDDDYQYDANAPIDSPLTLYEPIVDGTVLYMRTRNGVYLLDVAAPGDPEFRSLYYSGSEHELVRGFTLSGERAILAIRMTLGAGEWRILEGPQVPPAQWEELPPIAGDLNHLQFVEDMVYGTDTDYAYDADLQTQVATSWRLGVHNWRSGDGRDLITIEHPNPTNSSSFMWGGYFIINEDWIYGTLPTDQLPANEVWRLPRGGGELASLPIADATFDELIPFGVYDDKLYLIGVSQSAELVSLLAVSAEGGSAQKLAEVDRRVTAPGGVSALMPVEGGVVVQVGNHFFWVASGSKQAVLIACVDDPQRSLAVRGATIIGKDLYASVADMSGDQGSVARISLPF